MSQIDDETLRTTPKVSTGRDFFNILSLSASFDTRRRAPAQRAVRIQPLRRVLMTTEPPTANGGQR